MHEKHDSVERGSIYPKQVGRTTYCSINTALYTTLHYFHITYFLSAVLIYETDMPSMKTLQLLLLVLLPGLLTGSSNALTQCSYSEGILLPQDVTTSNDTPGCVVTIRDRQDCRTINEIMNSYNDIVGPGECVQFLFQPGEYFITSSTPVVLNYSLEMRAVDSGVSFSCDLTGTLDETGQASVSRTPIVFRRGLQETVVSLVGVDFHDCQALQFDDLDIVTITDCTFR